MYREEDVSQCGIYTPQDGNVIFFLEGDSKFQLNPFCFLLYFGKKMLQNKNKSNQFKTKKYIE